MSQYNPPICPKRLSTQQIIERARQVTAGYACSIPDTPADIFTICFDHVYEQYLYPKYEIQFDEKCDLGVDASGEKILGCYDALQNKIYLDSVLKKKSELVSRKRAFTAWHEVGHAVLHGPLLRKYVDAIGDGRILTKEVSITAAAESTFERQANLFAPNAAAPEWFLDYVLRSTFKLNRPIRYVGPRQFGLDVRGSYRSYAIDSFQELCELIAYHVRWRFGGLSVEALSYRVKESRWLLDVSVEPPAISPFTLLRKVGSHVAVAACS